MMSRNQRCPRSQREPNNNNRPRSYEHHFAFMATTVDSNPDLPGDDDDETYFIPGEPVETPAADDKYISAVREFEMYKGIKRLATVLMNIGGFLKEQHPELLCTMEKMSLFDGMVDSPDPGSKEGSHPLSYNLDADLKAESEWKPAAWREEQREGNTARTDTGTAASPTGQETVTAAEEILKNKGDRTKFQNDATLSKFPSSKQPDNKVRIFQNP
jgi:hypothetical protein